MTAWYTCDGGLAAGFLEADHDPAEQADGRVLRHVLAVRAHTLVVELNNKTIKVSS